MSSAIPAPRFAANIGHHLINTWNPRKIFFWKIIRSKSSICPQGRASPLGFATRRRLPLTIQLFLDLRVFFWNLWQLGPLVRWRQAHENSESKNLVQILLCKYQDVPLRARNLQKREMVCLDLRAFGVTGTGTLYHRLCGKPSRFGTEDY